MRYDRLLAKIHRENMSTRIHYTTESPKFEAMTASGITIPAKRLPSPLQAFDHSVATSPTTPERRLSISVQTPHIATTPTQPPAISLRTKRIGAGCIAISAVALWAISVYFGYKTGYNSGMTARNCTHF
jgi:hypothetical protein